jgi:MFS transporter
MLARAHSMTPIPHAAGIYLAILQLFFTLSWTVYAIYLPRLAAQAGIPRSAVILILMLDQAIFTLADFASGVAADKVSKTLGRIGYWVAGITLISCAAFLALPYVASAGTGAFLVLTVIWAVTSSALRAPPLMLLGKYCAKPAHPYLSALAMLGYGIAGALAPYLAITLRDIDPRWPFLLSSVSVAVTAIGLIAVERMLARQPASSVPSKSDGAPRSGGSLAAPALIFALAMVLLALGYQLHFAINSGPLFLRFAKLADLEWLLPIFWIGFNIAMFPATLLTKRWGGYAVMGAAALLGALAILGAAVAQGLGLVIAAQFAAGAAWGCILMSAFTVAFALGDNGAEGRMSGLLFSALALATFARMAAVATGLQADPGFAPLLQWLPIVCWTLAGAVLLTVAFGQIRRWAAAERSVH